MESRCDGLLLPEVDVIGLCDSGLHSHDVDIGPVPCDIGNIGVLASSQDPSCDDEGDGVRYVRTMRFLGEVG